MTIGSSPMVMNRFGADGKSDRNRHRGMDPLALDAWPKSVPIIAINPARTSG